MKRTGKLKSYTGLKRTGFKKKSRSEFSKRNKPTLPAISTLRNKADSFLTPIIKKLHPKCECGCGADTQVAHHWIEKSRSSFLRYVLDNLVGLSNSCHLKIHNKFGNSIVGGIDIAEKIIEKRSRAWHEKIKSQAKNYVKVNRAWYEENIARLSDILSSL